MSRPGPSGTHPKFESPFPRHSQVDQTRLVSSLWFDPSQIILKIEVFRIPNIITLKVTKGCRRRQNADKCVFTVEKKRFKSWKSNSSWGMLEEDIIQSIRSNFCSKAESRWRYFLFQKWIFNLNKGLTDYKRLFNFSKSAF